MAFPCTVNSDSISVGSSGGNPQWTVNVAGTAACAAGTTLNALSVTAGAGLFVPATKVWSSGDGAGALPYFVDAGGGFQLFPAGYGGPLVIAGAANDTAGYTLMTAHYHFENPTCHTMKIQVFARAQLNVTRPADVNATAGMLTSFVLPADFATGYTPGHVVPASAVGGMDLTYLSSNALTVTPTFSDQPNLVLPPGIPAEYYVELFFGVTNWNAHVTNAYCNFWSFLISAIGVVDNMT